jgi:hypothetical protein
MKNIFKLIFALVLAGLPLQAVAQTGKLQSGQVWGNPTGSAAVASPSTLSALFDLNFCSTQGDVLYRGGSLWACLATGTSGLPLVTQGASNSPHWATLANAALQNSSITLGSASVSLGGTMAQQTALNAIAPTPTRAGDLIYWNGTNWVNVAGNNSGTQVLSETSSGVPSWITASGTGTVTSITQGTGMSFSATPCTTACTINIATPVSAANGGTGVASPSAHTIPVNEGSSAQNNIATGTPGQFVGGNGSSTDPSYQSGPWVLLAVLTASNSASLSDTTHLTSTYIEYEIVFIDLIPASGSVSSEILVYSGGAFQTSGYAATGFAGATTVQPTTYIPVSNSAGAITTGPGINGSLRVATPSTSALHAFSGTVTYANIFPLNVSGVWSTAAPITGFEFCFSSSTPTCNVNITSGTIKIYGRL